MPPDGVRCTNHSMAAGRIGVAALLVPLLCGFAGLLMVSPEPGRNVVFGAFLLVLAALLVWVAVRTPIWIAMNDDRLLVRTLLGTRSQPLADIARIETGRMVSTIGGLGTRRYPHLTVVLTSGRIIRIHADPQIAVLLRARLERSQTRRTGERPPSSADRGVRP